MSSAQSQRIESCYRNLVPSLIFGKMDVNFFLIHQGLLVSCPSILSFKVLSTAQKLKFSIFTCTEEIFSGKLHFLCSEASMSRLWFRLSQSKVMSTVDVLASSKTAL